MIQLARGDFQTVWREHCKDEALLKQYAEAMKELAVQHWRGNNLRRTEWCREICTEFFHGGGYEKCLRKDCRRILMNLHEHEHCSCANDAEAWEQTLTRCLKNKNHCSVIKGCLFARLKKNKRQKNAWNSIGHLHNNVRLH